MKLFFATKAIIEFDGKILLLRESLDYEEGSHAGRYDIVGGRLEPEQPYLESLRREIDEETGLAVEIGEPFFVGEWWPVIKGEKCHVVAVTFRCTAASDHVVLSPDHDEYRWVDISELEGMHIIPNLRELFAVYKKKYHKVF
ncbi:NUDIX domain-containing protein [Candidatus Woesearchaeota archaeon]|nr:NUDIX domain-containing protein [Candidatus Woesearchaeota archaeon]